MNTVVQFRKPKKKREKRNVFFEAFQCIACDKIATRRQVHHNKGYCSACGGELQLHYFQVNPFVLQMPTLRDRLTTAGFFILILNIVIFILTRQFSGRPFQWGTLAPWARFLTVHAGGWHGIVTAIFMHANIEHLFMNMLALFLMGTFFERQIGTTFFIIIYLFSGVLANLTNLSLHMLISSGTTTWAALGASTSLSGVFAAMIINPFAHAESPTLMKNRIVPLAVLLLIMLMPFFFPHSTTDVLGHFFGAVFGVGIIFIGYPIVLHYSPKLHDGSSVIRL